ncbi:hypothetical protein GF369_03410 [Candidatus Peregrinibacteria bacterium]|nr:hypothetical protein [Candidatus Peregrinibacteria bacterium]
MADNQNKQNKQSSSSSQGGSAGNQKQSNAARKKRRKRRPRNNKPGQAGNNVLSQIGNAENTGNSGNAQKKQKKKKAVKKGAPINAKPVRKKPSQAKPNAPQSQQSQAKQKSQLQPQKKKQDADNQALTIETLGNKPLPNKKQQPSTQPEGTQGVNLGSVDEKKKAATDASPESKKKQNGKNSAEWDQLKNEIKKDHKKTEKELQEKKSEEKTPTPEVSAAAGGAVGAAAKATEEPPSENNETKQQDEVKPGEGEVIPPPNLPQDDLEKKEVIGIIVRYALGGCVVIALISALFFFNVPGRIYSGITGLFGGEQPQVEEQIPSEEQPDEEKSDRETTKELEATFVAGENQGTSRDKFEESVETALVSGDDKPIYTGAPDAIKTLFLTGLETTAPIYTDRIGSYMNVLLRLHNAFSTDIHQLLDNSSDREEALQVHMIDLEDIYQESMETYRSINEEKDAIKVQFNSVTTQKEQLEEDFFVSLEQLEGNKSNDLLNSFIEVSKRQVELKAHYNALNKVSSLFDTALANMDARIKDMKLNREALIEGVQIVDIKGSDLDLIIEESDLF